MIASVRREGTILTSRPFRPETIAVHAGRGIDPATGAVTPPLYLSTIYARDADGHARGGFDYGRDGNPNRRMLESCLSALEGGYDCVAFSSGMAAITAVVECLPSNLACRILLPRDMYVGLPGMLQATSLGRQFTTARVDMSDLAAVENACAALRPGVVWIETPSNPRLEITSIADVAAIAHSFGAAVVADNTFATPVLQRPLVLGADLVVQSATKYIGGSSDLMIGAVIAGSAGQWLEAMRSMQTHKGAVPSPFDCWLALRSVQSLVPRMRQHCASADAVARFLSGHADVGRVHYPGLPGHPGHEVARAQMSDFGGMLALELAGGAVAAGAFAAELRLFTRATSFGDAHSLIELRGDLLRLSIGLEHVSDLIEDLERGLEMRPC